MDSITQPLQGCAKLLVLTQTYDSRSESDLAPGKIIASETGSILGADIRIRGKEAKTYQIADQWAAFAEHACS